MKKLTLSLLTAAIVSPLSVFDRDALSIHQNNIKAAGSGTSSLIYYSADQDIRKQDLLQKSTVLWIPPRSTFKTRPLANVAKPYICAIVLRMKTGTLCVRPASGKYDRVEDERDFES